MKINNKWIVWPPPSVKKIQNLWDFFENFFNFSKNKQKNLFPVMHLIDKWFSFCCSSFYSQSIAIGWYIVNWIFWNKVFIHLISSQWSVIILYHIISFSIIHQTFIMQKVIDIFVVELSGMKINYNLILVNDSHDNDCNGHQYDSSFCSKRTIIC